MYIITILRSKIKKKNINNKLTKYRNENAETEKALDQKLKSSSVCNNSFFKKK